MAFALYAFMVAIYLSVGGLIQAKWDLPGIAFNEVFLLALPAFLFAYFMGLNLKKVFPFRTPAFRDWLLILLLTAIVIVFLETLVYFQEKIWPLPQKIQTFYEQLLVKKNWRESAEKFLILALVPAFCEEIFFRGFLQSLLSQEFPPWKTILLIALFFAVAHANPWYFSYYFCLGAFLAWCRYWRGNLWLCMLIHLANNAYSLYGG